jgi:hypothetical protein
MGIACASASSQSVSIASPPALTSYPFSGWVWFSHSDITTGPTAMAVYGSSFNEYYAVEVRGDVAGDPVRIRDQNISLAKAVASSNGYSANAWQGFGFRIVSTTDQSVFLNGTKTNGTSMDVFPTHTMDKFIFGAGGSNSGISGWINGAIGGIGFWNVALTDAEFDSLYKGFPVKRIRPAARLYDLANVRAIQEQIRNGAVTLNNSPTVAVHHRSYGI